MTEIPRLDTLHFNSTKTCNLSCAFCYDKAVRRKTENLSVEVVEALADDAAELGARRVILSGGEPLVRKDWRELAALFDARGMEVSLATNGTLLSPEVADFLAGLSKVTVSVSVDGDATTHDRLRGRSGAHRRTLAGLQALRDAGVRFDVNATMFEGNLDDLDFLTRLARDYDCNVRLSLLHPNGRGEQLGGSAALDLEAIMRLREYCHLMRGWGVPIFVNLPPLLQYIDEIIPGRGAACGWAENFCGVLANGDVTICGVASDEPHLVAGNLRTQRFRDIWTHAEIFSRTRALRVEDLGGVCGRCPFREFCGGACRLSAYREAGDFLASYSLCQRFFEAGYIPATVLDDPRPSEPALSTDVGTINRKVRRLPVLL